MGHTDTPTLRHQVKIRVLLPKAKEPSKAGREAGTDPALEPSKGTWAVVTKCHQLSGLDNKNVHLTIVEPGSLR